MPVTKAARKSILLLSGGTLIGKGIVVAVAPILTRLYTPADFGLYGVIDAIILFLLLLATLRYEVAIPIAETTDEAMHTAFLAVLSAIVLSAVCGMVLLVGAETIFSVLHVEGVARYSWIIPVGVLVGSSFQAFSYWEIRQQRFNTLSQTRIYQGMGMAVGQLGLGLLAIKPLGLLVGGVAGHSAGLGKLARSFWKDIEYRNASLQGLWAAAVRYKRYPLISVWGTAANNAIVFLIPLILATAWAVDELGAYVLVLKVLALPLILVGQSVGQVYQGQIGTLIREKKDEVWLTFRRYVLALAVIGVIPFSMLFMFGEPAFVFVFGTEWAQAGQFASLLSVAYLLQFVSGPVSQTLNMINRQEVQTTWDVARLLVVVACLWFAFAQDFRADQVVALLSGLLAISYILLILVTGVILKRKSL